MLPVPLGQTNESLLVSKPPALMKEGSGTQGSQAISVLEALSNSQVMSESFLVENCLPLIFQDQSINSELSLLNRSTWCPGLLTSPPFSLAAMPE